MALRRTDEERFARVQDEREMVQAELRQMRAEVAELGCRAPAADSSMVALEVQEHMQREFAEMEAVWQQRLGEATTELASARQEEALERGRLVRAVAEGESAIADLLQAHSSEFQSFDVKHTEALAQREAEVTMARLEIRCAQEEAERQVNLATDQWRQRVSQAERSLREAREELAWERANATLLQSDSDRALVQSGEAQVQELHRRDAAHMEVLALRDQEMDRLRRQAQEENEEADRQRSEADGWRHMLMKITGDLNAANDEIAREREVAAKAVAECERLKADFHKAHADELTRQAQAHADGLERREADVARARRELQVLLEERERQRAETERYVSELHRTHSDELTNVGWAHAEALQKKDAEIDRARQEAQLARDEAQFKRAEAENMWRQRCAEAEANLKALRQEINLTRADHAQTVAARDADIERLRKEVGFERKESERKRLDVEDALQKRVQELEGALVKMRMEFQKERERMLQAQVEVENALADVRNTQADDLTRVLSRHADELAQRDAEIEVLRRDLQHEREEGERLCSTVDDAWRSRLAECEKELATLQADVVEQRAIATKCRADGATAVAELREASARELSCLVKEHSAVLEKRDGEFQAERRVLVRERERVERERAEVEETLQRKVSQLEGDLKATREVMCREQEKTLKSQADCRRTVEHLEEAQAQEALRKAAEHAKALAQSHAEADAARKGARSEREAAEHHEHEAKEAWLWLSRVEGDLKVAQRDLKQERAAVAQTVAGSERSTMELRMAHAENLARINAEHDELASQRQAQQDRLRAELREAGAEERARAAATARQAEELEQARLEARQLRDQAERRTAEVDEAWQRRMAEAEARSSAAMDLATQSVVDGQRALAALGLCRAELAEERRFVQELRSRGVVAGATADAWSPSRTGSGWPQEFVPAAVQQEK